MAGDAEWLERVARLPDLDSESGDAHVAELSQRALLLIQTDFEPTTWQAFWGIVVDGLTAAEVGTRMGISQAAAFKAKSRVLHRLRQELDGLLD
jgi:RNA polymerase sigma-70 factor (ECF subfamily)